MSGKRDQKCFVCDKNDVGSFDNEGFIYANNAIIFEAGGNYESQVWDIDIGKLIIFICDDCIEKRKNKITTYFTQIKTERIYSKGIGLSEDKLNESKQ